MLIILAPLSASNLGLQEGYCGGEAGAGQQHQAAPDSLQHIYDAETPQWK